MDGSPTLDQLRPGARALITAVAWATLAPEEAKRLQALGIDEGAEIGVVHRGVFGTHDPIAITIGRAMVAIRRVHAAAITVEVATAEIERAATRQAPKQAPAA